MRSGTHLLIDILLNHFPPYRKRPLYLDFDQYVRRGLPLEPVLTCGNYVIKTHYPQNPLPEAARELLARLREKAVVICPQRNELDVKRSLKNFQPETTEDDFHIAKKAFENEWGGVGLCVRFDEMVNPERFPSVIEALARELGLPLPSIFHPPPSPSERSRVIRLKLLTRLLGPLAPQINTTIRFNAHNTQMGGPVR
jgi:hypothetical protein